MRLISIIMTAVVVSVVHDVHMQPGSGPGWGEAWQGTGLTVKGPSYSPLCFSQEFSKFP